jgi:hypothetical protein
MNDLTESDSSRSVTPRHGAARSGEGRGILLVDAFRAPSL